MGGAASCPEASPSPICHVGKSVNLPLHDNDAANSDRPVDLQPPLADVPIRRPLLAGCGVAQSIAS